MQESNDNTKYLGVGLRSRHLLEFAQEPPRVGFVEVHSENYLACSGIDYDLLQLIREDMPLSLHGVGMSLGSACGINIEHAENVQRLASQLQPFLLSEHLSWSSAGGHFLPDLIPFPFNDEALKIFTNNIHQAQDILGRQMLVENPSSYFAYKDSAYSESEFINMLCKMSGCGLLLDVNNTYISAINNNFDAYNYIDELNASIVGEIHISGHSKKDLGGGRILYVDSHDDFVIKEVWDLYEYALQKFGKTHTLLEWDAQIPELQRFVSHAQEMLPFLESAPIAKTL